MDSIYLLLLAMVRDYISEVIATIEQRSNLVLGIIPEHISIVAEIMEKNFCTIANFKVFNYINLGSHVYSVVNGGIRSNYDKVQGNGTITYH